jgi:hypothetical protein
VVFPEPTAPTIAVTSPRFAWMLTPARSSSPGVVASSPALRACVRQHNYLSPLMLLVRGTSCLWLAIGCCHPCISDVHQDIEKQRGGGGCVRFRTRPSQRRRYPLPDPHSPRSARVPGGPVLYEREKQPNERTCSTTTCCVLSLS